MLIDQDLRVVTEVAVGIVFDPSGQVLLAQRPHGKPYAGWWEFPGGKLEPGESVHDALSRELHEELGIDVAASYPWLTREHSYEHARVRLHFRRVFEFAGMPRSREGQAFGWCDPVAPGVGPLLPASVPLMRLLGLPDRYAISCASLMSHDAFLQKLRRELKAGLSLLQLREPGMAEPAFTQLFDEVLPLCRTHGARLLVNSCHARAYWHQADGVHLRTRDLNLLAALSNNERPQWVGASCHNADELAQAAGADFAVLGPVKPTLSHPQATPTGWPALTALIEQSPLPIYALGGITRADAPQAQQAGAHGIAMMRAAFA